METSGDNLRYFMESREIFYRIFSEMLYDVPQNTEILQQLLTAVTVLKESIILPDGRGQFDKAVQEITGRLGGSDRGDLIQSLAKEYTRLFLLGASSAPLSASPYFSPLKVMFQEPRTKVKKVYTDSGMIINTVQRVPEDHAAIELSFLSRMSGEVLKGSGDRRSTAENIFVQASFISEHLMPLLGAVSSRIPPEFRGGFYDSLITVIKSYADSDLSMLSLLEEEKELICLD